MKTRNLFYHLQTTSDTQCHLTKEAYAEARQTWLCPGCLTPKPGVAAVDAWVQVPPTKEPLNVVLGAGLPIATRKLISSFDPSLVHSDLYLGHVFGPDGRELKDWATFRGKHRLIVRGSEDATFRNCNVCGRALYFAMGKSYLYPAPPSGASLFESDLRGLILTEEILMQSGVERIPGIHIEKLAVLDAPKDQFGELTNNLRE